MREPRTTTPWISAAGGPSRLIWVVAEASRLSGSGETVRRPPASEADTFSCGGTHCAAPPPERAAFAPPRVPDPVAAPETATAITAAASASSSDAGAGDPPACAAASLGPPVSALHGSRGADQRAGGVQGLHGDVRAGRGRNRDRGLEAAAAGAVVTGRQRGRRWRRRAPASRPRRWLRSSSPTPTASPPPPASPPRRASLPRPALQSDR